MIRQSISAHCTHAPTEYIIHRRQLNETKFKDSSTKVIPTVVKVTVEQKVRLNYSGGRTVPVQEISPSPTAE